MCILPYFMSKNDAKKRDFRLYGHLQHRNFELDFMQQIWYIYIVKDIFVDAHTKMKPTSFLSAGSCRSMKTALLRVPLCSQEGFLLYGEMLWS